ncbi:DUF6338 family protein [Neolewinella sp.]|uniref:DUF6338 family protein n=1 Tax=Neolewinella sp. TaxID=2993543 RepID=UPI003B52EF49
MSLALGALLLVLFLLPGIIFRYFYLRSETLRKTVDFSLLSEAVFILVPSLLLHLLGGNLVAALGSGPDTRTLYLLLAGSVDDTALAVVERSLTPFILYILLLCVLGGLLGMLGQYVVLRRGWDEQFRFLRIYNDWDKYFSGRVLSPERRKLLAFVQVDVVVSGGEGDILYTGELNNYSLNRDQGIDRIFISKVYRRRFRDDIVPDPPAGNQLQPFDRSHDPRYYNMPGNFLVIPFSQVRNLNIVYVSLQPTDEPPPPPVEPPAP